MLYVYDRQGRTVRRSKNLRGVLTHYRAKPQDIVVKVCDAKLTDGYTVTFYWQDGDHCATTFADWRVLLTWLAARRAWSIQRVTFDAPLYDKIEASEPNRFAAFRKTGNLLTRHAYKTTLSDVVNRCIRDGSPVIEEMR
jgi:hypothetical protein